jgi:hypothetical protein
MGFEKDVKLIGKRFEVANIGHVIAEKHWQFWISGSFCCSSFVSLSQNKKKAELIKAKMTGSSLVIAKQWVERFSKLQI